MKRIKTESLRTEAKFRFRKILCRIVIVRYFLHRHDENLRLTSFHYKHGFFQTKYIKPVKTELRNQGNISFQQIDLYSILLCGIESCKIFSTDRFYCINFHWMQTKE